MAYTKTNWENDVTELSAENFNHMEDGIYNSTNLELVGVYNEISEVPTNTPNGKLFYLSSTNKIYEVTNTGAYHEFAEPISGIFYIVPSEQKNYAYDGTTLVSVGGGGGSVTGDTLPIGSMVPFGSINVPAGWLVCDGSEVSRTTYSELFAVIGTSYGAGDGSTTFNLPNKKGRNSVGLDTSDTDFNTIGKTGGEKTHTLTIEEMPEHNHYGSPLGTNNMSTNYQAGDNVYLGVGYNGSTSNTGGNQPHNNVQPFEVDQWIIKASQTAGLVASVVNTPSMSDTDTYSCDYINKLNTYSTEEKVVGEWIDGKPLYRRVFIGTKGNNTQVNVGSIIDVNDIIKIQGTLGSDDRITQSVGGYMDSRNNSSFIYFNYANNSITLVSPEIYNGKYIITIEYTKTTD